jgi:hypothetical protein
MVIWDVQYGIIRVQYEICVIYYRIFKQFWECRFLTQNGPGSPQNHQNISSSLLIFHMLLISSYSIGSSQEGRFRGGNCLKRQKIAQ